MAKAEASGANENEIHVLGEYSETFNGIALDINDMDAEKISKLPSVKNIYPITSPVEFKKRLLDIYTDKNFEMSQNLLCSLGFDKSNVLLFI